MKEWMNKWASEQKKKNGWTEGKNKSTKWGQDGHVPCFEIAPLNGGSRHDCGMFSLVAAFMAPAMPPTGARQSNKMRTKRARRLWRRRRRQLGRGTVVDWLPRARTGSVDRRRTNVFLTCACALVGRDVTSVWDATWSGTGKVHKKKLTMRWPPSGGHFAYRARFPTSW